MNEQFLNYSQSLVLKELGFDEPCMSAYFHPNINGIKYPQYNYSNTGLMMGNDGCTAPLKQQAFKFFREKYNLLSEILLDKTTYPKYCFEINKYEDFGNYEKIKIEDWGLYRNYEEAEQACLDKLIEIVKNK